MKRFALAIVLGLVGLAVYLYFYLGAYKTVEPRIVKLGPLPLLYKNHMGPYHQINSTIQSVEDWVRTHGMICARTFGEYLDDPQGVDEDRLRAHAGCVLDVAPVEPVSDEFKFEMRPERRYAETHFNGSPAIGPWRVYPKMKAFIADERLRSTAPVIEIYTVNGNRVDTEYLFPLDE